MSAPVRSFFPDSSLHNPLLDIKDEHKKQVVESTTKPFRYSIDECEELKQIFRQEMLLGLSSDLSDRKRTCLLMENTFMTKLPSGRETGDFLSLDLGSTNFRVILSRLRSALSDAEEDDQFTIKYYDVPVELRIGSSAVPLFDFLAVCIKDFVTEKGLTGRRLPLAFSFSYPMINKAVDSGILVTWTKSYDLPDAVGKDAVTFLRDAIARQAGLQIDVLAILNDSTGTLLKGAYLDKDCMIGMIFGSGFNCCYVERVDRIKKLSEVDRRSLSGSETVAVDIECGGFGDNGCIDRFKSQIDKQLDTESLFCGSYSFEKMLAGNFIGDVMRRILVQIVEKGALLEGTVSTELRTSDSISAADLVAFEKEGEPAIRKVFARIGYNNMTDEDVAIIQFVGRIVAIRAALLTSSRKFILETCLPASVFLMTHDS